MPCALHPRRPARRAALRQAPQSASSQDRQNQQRIDPAVAASEASPPPVVAGGDASTTTARLRSGSSSMLWGAPCSFPPPPPTRGGRGTTIQAKAAKSRQSSMPRRNAGRALAQQRDEDIFQAREDGTEMHLGKSTCLQGRPDAGEIPFRIGDQQMQRVAEYLGLSHLGQATQQRRGNLGRRPPQLQ